VLRHWSPLTTDLAKKEKGDRDSPEETAERACAFAFAFSFGSICHLANNGKWQRQREKGEGEGKVREDSPFGLCWDLRRKSLILCDLKPNC
jgi:hypothetical protein